MNLTKGQKLFFVSVNVIKHVTFEEYTDESIIVKDNENNFLTFKKNLFDTFIFDDKEKALISIIKESNLLQSEIQHNLLYKPDEFIKNYPEYFI